MKAPSQHRLETELGLTPEQARLVRRIARAHETPESLRQLIDAECPSTAAYVRSLYSDPYDTACWVTTVALHAIDATIGTYGVEPLGPQGSHAPYSPPYEYCNTGDSYGATLIYRRKTDTLCIGCWGDIAEKHPTW